MLNHASGQSFPLQTKYREKPDSIKFTTVVDSPDLVHAKNSYLHCNEVGSSSNPGQVMGCRGLVLDEGASHLGDVGPWLVSSHLTHHS